MHSINDDKKAKARQAAHERPTWPAGVPEHRLPTATREEPKRRQAGAFKASGKRSASRGRILVVDDEPLILVALTRLLQEDHDLVTVDSGNKAQDILEKDSRFDLVLCDMSMPGVSGIDLHEWVARRNPGLAERIVFITGGSYTPRAVEFLNRVSNPTLKKPFDLEEIRSLIQKMCELTL